MSTWFAGPVERRIQPPMKNVITIYHRSGNVAIYVTESAFLKERPSHNVRRLATEIVRQLNELETTHGEDQSENNHAST